MQARRLVWLTGAVVCTQLFFLLGPSSDVFRRSSDEPHPRPRHRPRKQPSTVGSPQPPQQAPPQRPGAHFGRVQLPPPPAGLVVAFANLAMSKYAINWLLHVRQVRELRPYVLVTLDDDMQKVCDDMGEPAVPAALLHGNSSLALDPRKGAKAYVRNDAAEFKKLGKVKALFTEQLLSLGYDVLLSDVDSVWLRDPWPFLGGALAPALRDADLLVTNDYADVRRDLDMTTVFNTGALMLRAGPRALAFVREWAQRTERTGLIGNDQTELNRLLSSQYRDGDFRCTTPDCLEKRKMSVAALAVYEAGPGGTRCPEDAPAHKHGDEAEAGVGARARARVGARDTPVGVSERVSCTWAAAPRAVDPWTNLTTVDVVGAHASLSAFEAIQRRLGRRVRRGWERVPHWMWGGRLRVGLLPMGHFLQGHTFFVQHLHEQLATPPVHVHITYTMAGDYGKRFRLRAAGLWQAETASHYSTGSFVHVVGVREVVLRLLNAMDFPDPVWRCSEGEAVSNFFAGASPADFAFLQGPPEGPDGGNLTGGEAASRLCYHPRHFVPSTSEPTVPDFERLPDPATPQVRVQFLTRLVLRNAFALSARLRRRLILPRVWCLCDRYWWQLKDCRMPGAEGLTMPFDCPMDLIYNVNDWERLENADLGKGQFVEASFLSNPQTQGDINRPSAAWTVRIARDTAAMAEARDDPLPDCPEDLAADEEPCATRVVTGNHRQTVVVPSGSTVDDVADAIEARAGARDARVLRISAASLLRVALCGFRDAGARRIFESDVAALLFRGQHSYCSSERNPNLGLIIREGLRRGMTEEQALIKWRNCTGNPDNAFNKPKVDMGPGALHFRDSCTVAPRDPSPAAVHFAAALSLGAAPQQDLVTASH